MSPCVVLQRSINKILLRQWTCHWFAALWLRSPGKWFFSRAVNWIVYLLVSLHKMIAVVWIDGCLLNSQFLTLISVRTNSTSSTQYLITPHVGRLCIYWSDVQITNVLVQLSMWLAVPLLKQLQIAYGGMDANTERGNRTSAKPMRGRILLHNQIRKQCIY